MKYLILVAILYGVYRISQMKKLTTPHRDQLNDQEEDDGFTEYEEVD